MSCWFGSAGSFAPLVEPVPYGEIPLASGRFDALRELLDELQARSFKGSVEVRSYSGRFCVVGTAADQVREIDVVSRRRKNGDG